MPKTNHETQIRNRIRLMGGKYKFNYQGVYDGRKQTTAIAKIAGKYYMATAECSKKDQFNKKIGRAVALGRVWKAFQDKHSRDIADLKRTAPMALFKEDREDEKNP